jgi:3D-(3,5/4)-trihydroxycyclohexane-1,2-dione acylhydrolase (decyclizing)
MTVRKTTAQAIVEFLKQQFVLNFNGQPQPFFQGVWGIFGHGNVAGVGQALEEGRGSLPFYQGKNEQAMVHAATAFAKARKRRACMVCTTSIGPGATNLVTGAATATVNRLPVLLLPGDVFSRRRPDPVLQQLEHPLNPDVSVNDCLRPVSKFWDRIHHPEQLLTSLPEAVRTLLDPGETGAVTIALPQDIQAEAFDFPDEFFTQQIHHILAPAPATKNLEALAKKIRRARRPLIVAGGGVHYSGAQELLTEVSNRHGLPVATTQAGTGAISAKNDLHLGSIGVTGTAASNSLARTADLVIAIGSRLSDFTTASMTLFQNPDVELVSININPRDASKNFSLPIVADARTSMAHLLPYLEGHRSQDTYVSEIKSLISKWNQDRSAMIAQTSPTGLITIPQVIETINAQSRNRSPITVVHAAGGIPGDIHRLWNSADPSDYHSEYGYSCMGYEIAGALGVKLAEPERQVIALLGDGSYLMLAQEIMTAVQYEIPITIVLCDNSGFQCIENLQSATGGTSFGNRFTSSVDFMANAKSLGAQVTQVHSTRDLAAALTVSESEISRQKGPRLIYIQVAPDIRLPGTAWWDVPMSEVSKRPKTKAARADYDQERKKQRRVLRPTSVKGEHNDHI